MRASSLRIGLLSILGLAVACGGNNSTVSSLECADGIDNDGDGFADEADLGCELNHRRSESPDPRQCADGQDNDGDGAVDLADDGCESSGDALEAEFTGPCNDGFDNDGDQLVDFPDDPGCDSAIDEDESDIAACSNGVDDDGDGAVDFPADSGCASATDHDENLPPLPQCANGLDDDGDLVIDFPDEPGCLSAADDDETDPAVLPECSNGYDDDGDALNDYPNDPGCDFAADDAELDECYPGRPIATMNPWTGTGFTYMSGTTDEANGFCGGAGGAEDVHSLTISTTLLSLTIDTDSPNTYFDTVLYVRSEDCASGAEIACNDDVAASNGPSSVTFVPTTGTRYFVFVDSKTTGLPSPYYDIDLSGVIAAGAPCNLAAPAFACEAGYACQDSGGEFCLPAQCNDTIDNDADGAIDFASDPGCASLSDNDEREECVPGAFIAQHPGGIVADSTSGTTSYLSPPCTSYSYAERVYEFENTRADVSSLVFDVVTGGSFNPVLYVRTGTCAPPGDSTTCTNAGGLDETLQIATPATGTYFVIVDSFSAYSGDFILTIQGRLPNGASCDIDAVDYVCDTGLTCGAVSGTCDPPPCSDGDDNDGDGKIDDADPGCDSSTDTDETDPAVAPACADGIDNDTDGNIDYPADTDCARAADLTESGCVHDPCVTGYLLDSTCDSCVAGTCADDSYCCTTAWDDLCVSSFKTLCPDACP